MATKTPERPKDPQLAELHDLAIQIRDRNENRAWIERYGWLFYGASFVFIFIPGQTATIIWAGALLIGLAFTIAAIVYQTRTNPLRRQLYEKSTRIRRQSSYEIIDQVKAALPNKNVTVNPDGNIGLTDKEEKE